jgi:hypothetical protein
VYYCNFMIISNNNQYFEERVIKSLLPPQYLDRITRDSLSV